MKPPHNGNVWWGAKIGAANGVSLMNQRTIKTTGATIQVEMAGAGDPALAFLHYWGGSSRTWQEVIRRLGGEPLAIALNQRGWAGSVATDGSLRSPRHG
jgi:pimeloyl-ACP methyl ester carboxylesterase